MDLAQQLTDRSLSSVLSDLETALFNLDVGAIRPTLQSISRFVRLSAKEQHEILIRLTKYTEILGTTEVEIPQKSPREVEVARLKKGMKSFGLKAKDLNVFDVIDESDVIELYNSQGIQLYRNTVFCRLSSYNLLDLSVHSWDELYEKPSAITEGLKAIVVKILSPNGTTLPYNLGQFIQRETLIYAQSLRTFMVTPKYISPVLDEETGDPAGFLSTYSATIYSEGRDVNNINILTKN